MQIAACLAGLLMCSGLALPQPEYALRLDEAWDRFFNGDYVQAAGIALDARRICPDDPASYELRDTALLFDLRRRNNRGKAGLARLLADPEYPGLRAEFEAEERMALALVRRRLRAEPEDPDLNFYLARLDLNRIWFNLQVLGEKDGFGEFKEAKKCLARTLRQEPRHARALAASAWISYIVAGRSWLEKLILGFEHKDQAFAKLELALACAGCLPSALSEAKFAQMEMLTQEGRTADARDRAAELLTQYPENKGLREFLSR